MSRLEILKKSLEKKEAEYESVSQENYNYVMSLRGEPLGGTPAGRRFQKKTENYSRKLENLQISINKTKEAINRITSKVPVDLASDIQELKDKIAGGGPVAVIYRHKRKLKELESLLNRDKENNLNMSQHTKDLIASGVVVKWDKNPIYYFVKGFRKTAVVIKNGGFVSSNKYPILEKDKVAVESILGLTINKK